VDPLELLNELNAWRIVARILETETRREVATRRLLEIVRESPNRRG
jgi:hypothetical protein